MRAASRVPGQRKTSWDLNKIKNSGKFQSFTEF